MPEHQSDQLDLLREQMQLWNKKNLISVVTNNNDSLVSKIALEILKDKMPNWSILELAETTRLECSYRIYNLALISLREMLKKQTDSKLEYYSKCGLHYVIKNISSEILQQRKLKKQ